MMIYFAKFIACSGLLLAVYHLLLKNKAMYRFNRIFLLAGIVFSLAVPFIQFQQHMVNLPQVMPVEQPAQLQVEQPVMATKSYADQANINNASVTTPIIVSAAPVGKPVNYLLVIGLSVYGIVTALLLFRFLRNLYKINCMTATNEHIDYEEAELVLIPQRFTPHSFFKYIFLNRDDFRQQKIEDKILHHELAHTRQYHSADVVFAELVQVFCWFNPFLILYRKSIQLNHEFLADEAVLNSDTDVRAYQYLLLSNLAQGPGLSVTSQFSYALTKKRLLMMTKKTSRRVSVLSRLVTLLIVGVVFVLFCNATVQKQKPASKKIYGRTIFGNMVAHGDTLEPPTQELFFIQFPLKKVAYPSIQKGASKQMLDEYAALTHKYKAGWAKSGSINNGLSEADMNRLTVIYKHMSVAQQKQQMLRFDYMPMLQPLAKHAITVQDEWRNKKLYSIWIDDKHINNNELSNYKVDDLAVAFISKIAKNTLSYKSYKYQLQLTTVNKYNEYYKKALADQYKSHLYIAMTDADVREERAIKKEKLLTGTVQNADKPINVTYTKGKAFVPVIAPLTKKDTSKVRFPPPRFNYPHTQKGLSQQQLNEYASIVSKYPIMPFKRSWKLKGQVTITDSAKLEQLYRNMSIAQQDVQVICFIKSEAPRDMVAVTDEQLENYKDKAMYDVWVNYRRANDGELNKYKAADLVIAFATQKLNKAISHTKYSYHVSLFTADFYRDYYKKALADLKKSFIIIRHHDPVEMQVPVVKANYIEKGTVAVDSPRKFAEIKFPKPYPYTKDGVSQPMLDEYKAIIEKHENLWGNIPPRERRWDAKDRARLITIYRQMSREQQQKQIVTFQYGFPQRPAVRPTQAQLNAFKDAHVYGVWIDDKKVANAELSTYSPADFGDVYISRLTPQAIDYNKYKYQVGLSTSKFNEASRKASKNDVFEDHMWTKMGPGGFEVKNDKYRTKKPEAATKTLVGTTTQANVNTKPREGVPPTEAELASYQNDTYYWVFVNGKRVWNNTVLRNYKADELVRVYDKNLAVNGEPMANYTNVVQFVTTNKYDDYRSDTANKQQHQVNVSAR